MRERRRVVCEFLHMLSVATECSYGVLRKGVWSRRKGRDRGDMVGRFIVQ